MHSIHDRQGFSRLVWFWFGGVAWVFTRSTVLALKRRKGRELRRVKEARNARTQARSSDQELEKKKKKEK